uniref:Uncharacterized protein n=1 Tax=Salmonella phage PMBT37 TaxID=3153515 RepID=A0AAU8GKL5_9CAUD
MKVINLMRRLSSPYIFMAMKTVKRPTAKSWKWRLLMRVT